MTTAFLRVDEQFRVDRLALSLGMLLLSSVCLFAWPSSAVAAVALFGLTGVLFVHQFGTRGSPLALGFMAALVLISVIGLPLWQGMAVGAAAVLSTAGVALYSAWIAELHTDRIHRASAESDLGAAANNAATQLEGLENILSKQEGRLKTWASLIEVVRGCSSTLKLDGLASFAMPAVESLFPEDQSGLWIDQGGNVPHADGLDRLAAKYRQNILVADQKMDHRIQGADEYGFEGRSALACPLIEDHQVYGNLSVTSKVPDRFGHEDMAILSHVAGVVSMSAMNVRLYERMEELALKDAQTGMFKRYHFEARMAEESRRALRHNIPLSLILFDIDHFKQVNDTYGHGTGDGVLTKVGGMIRAVNWAGTLTCRWGGEEFLLALPDATLDRAGGRALAIMREIKSHSFAGTNAADKLPDGSPTSFHVTVSAGVASFPADTRDPESLFQICDRRLYVAKNTGRDRLVDHD